ncbi:MAG: InlB B-repeat-containing protein [Sphaerochaetaceae bacterium]|nr:InlB B-repeat-containing protein [Sphaerochaetaceae bacterium]
MNKKTLFICLQITILLLLTGCDVADNPILTYQSVEFHSNDATAGSVPVFYITTPVGASVTIPENTGNLAKEGYEFLGWNTEADGSGNYFYPGDEFAMPAVYVVLYAAWERIYQIGETGPAGGLVFYDKKMRTDGWRFLEAAPVETEWITRIWGEQSAPVVEGTSDAIGSGEANTQLIINEFAHANSGNYAAFLCATLEYGGCRDWFLPSTLELNEMYENLYLYSFGDFSNDHYWSSTANSAVADVAYAMYFVTGEAAQSSTYYDRSVRAIRTF